MTQVCPISSPLDESHSLRRDLLFMLMMAIVGSFMVAAVSVYFMARYEVDEVMDYHLRQLALAQRDSIFDTPPAFSAREQAFDMVIQIWDAQGLRLYYSHPHAVLPERAQMGYATVSTLEGKWRTYSMMMERRVVQVAQPMVLRTRLAASAALRMLFPLGIALPLVGFLIWFLLGKGLSPLDKLANAVRARRPDALEPLSANNVPEEALPLVNAINGLLGRLDTAMKAQRAFVADAAHELRTPLTALQLQLQLLERADSAEERQASLAEVKAGLHRTTHLAQQLLALARTEPEGVVNALQSIDLHALVAQVVADLQPLAEVRQIDLGVERLEDGVTLLGDSGGIRALLSNLVNNAIRYTPEDGRVDVSAYRGQFGGEDCVWLEVCDNGPGIPLSERDRVFDRFYRRAGQSQSGSGLGLAIVKAIADRHGAHLLLEDASPHGLRARVAFARTG